MSTQIGIVIVAHGRLAQEYLAAVEHVVGHQPNMKAVSIDAEFDREAKQNEISAAAKSVDSGAGVVIVTDMFGSSPSNLAINACEKCQRNVVYGANLPLLIKLSKSKYKPLKQAVECALNAGRKYINCHEIKESHTT